MAGSYDGPVTEESLYLLCNMGVNRRAPAKVGDDRSARVEKKGVAFRKYI